MWTSEAEIASRRCLSLMVVPFGRVNHAVVAQRRVRVATFMKQKQKNTQHRLPPNQPDEMRGIQASRVALGRPRKSVHHAAAMAAHTWHPEARAVQIRQLRSSLL